MYCNMVINEKWYNEVTWLDCLLAQLISHKTIIDIDINFPKLLGLIILQPGKGPYYPIYTLSLAQVGIIPQVCIIVVQDYGIYCNKRYMLFAALNSAVIQKMKR
jgi:hypothetical protein